MKLAAYAADSTCCIDYISKLLLLLLLLLLLIRLYFMLQSEIAPVLTLLHLPAMCVHKVPSVVSMTGASTATIALATAVAQTMHGEVMLSKYIKAFWL